MGKRGHAPFLKKANMHKYKYAIIYMNHLPYRGVITICKTPLSKLTAYEGTANFSEMEIFEMLDKLKPTACGLNTLPAWFLHLATPIFATPLADLFNMSLAASYTPHQWKTTVIKPIPKNSSCK